MPCDSIRTVRVDIAKTNDALLDKAALALGWKVEVKGRRYVTKVGEVVTVGNGTLTMRGVDQEYVAGIRNALMRSYSKQVIGAAARQFGWTVEQTGPNTAVLGRS